MPVKTRSHLACLIAALQYIYITPEWNERIFALLSAKIMKGKKATGRKGMSLWEIFVLSQVRLCMGLSYDQLEHTANYDTLVRGILGVLPTDYTLGKEYEYQNIYDNVGLLDEALLKEINEVIVQVGHQVFKKKDKAALRLKTDTFVVETNTHFPTDYNLLFDSARKCIDVAQQLDLPGWRKGNDWRRELKIWMRVVGKAGKTEKVKQAAISYLKKARSLEDKVLRSIIDYQPCSLLESFQLDALFYYYDMLQKHIDLVDRRLIKGQAIPHDQKVFSIFEPYTEFIKKGKLRPNVEIGKKLALTTDQHHLIVDWQVVDNQSDNQLTISIVDRLLTKHTIQSLSVDKGFSNAADKALLELFIPEVIMPKKGKCNQQEKATESAPIFKKLRNKHSAIESSINELECRGLDRCPDRGRRNFDRYVGLGITAYNLHKIGKHMLLQLQKTEERKKKREKKRRALAQAA